MDFMLGKNKITLRDSMYGPLEDFCTKISGPDGLAWEEEFKRFLRKEQSWNSTRVAIMSTTLFHPPLPLWITIDTDVTPFIPAGLSLEGEGAEHRGMGNVTLEKRDDELYINDRKAERYLSMRQQGGGLVRGYEVARELQAEPTLNACILDALYENQQFIPHSWDRGSTYFWATKFCDENGGVCVECLYRNGKQWCRRHRWLGGNWRGREHAARLANLPMIA